MRRDDALQQRRTGARWVTVRVSWVHMNDKTVTCFGEVLLRLAAPGKELLLQSARLDAHVGGAEANVAVSLSQFGHRTRVITALPESALGRACAGELRRHGVDTGAVSFRPGRMGVYFLTHGAGYRPAEVLYDRSNSAFAVAPADLYQWKTLLAGTSWMHVSGITPAVSDSAGAAGLAALTTARQVGAGTSFDCNFRARLWGNRANDAPPVLRRYCEQAEVIFGDARDIELILGHKADPGAAGDQNRRAADAAFRAFPNLRHLACTERGRDSVEVQQLTGWLYGKSGQWHSRSYPLHGIVDRIGAGDAFAAGVLHGLLTGLSEQQVVDFGTAAACLKHSIPGDFNLVSTSDVELLLSEQRADVRR
jgi:2-dehydro-3-deoxygluconokinase